jgi:PHD/YefM family antitoxin component YafN of YafNO toxin-antitoxin module
MGAKVMEKPTFSVEQLISASSASKNFGSLRKKAQTSPQFITDNGSVDTVVMGYDYFEKLYERLTELEEKEEENILLERIERLENNPSSAVDWREIRRSGKENE